MRILQICHKPPQPSIDGGCLAMDALTQGLIENGAEVKVISASTTKHPFQVDLLEPEYVQSTGIEAVKIETKLDYRDAYIALLNGDSYNISRFYAHHFAMVIKHVLSRRRYDVVHLESLYTTPYIDVVRQHAPKALISLRSHNHEFQIWEQQWKASHNPLSRLILRHLTKTLERYEKDILKEVDTIVSISEQEAKGYRDWGFEGPLHVAGFGTKKLSTAPSPSLPIPRSENSFKLFHLGAMDWAPNREGIDWFVKTVWPVLSKKFDHIELHLAGKGLRPSAYQGLERVFNHGEVPNAQEFSDQFDLLVVPLLRGAGIRVKIVEAMANGIPVATTLIGASGLDMEDQECILHSKPEDMAQSLSDLIESPERLEQMRVSSIKAIEHRFDLKKIGSDLLEFYAEHVQS